jgi:hypothetical protein
VAGAWLQGRRVRGKKLWRDNVRVWCRCLSIDPRKEGSPIYRSPSVEKNVSIPTNATHSYCTSFKQFTCDQGGAKQSIDDIKVTIPPGAIPSGTVHNIEMCVAMYGPFKFSENYRPVSPILWFCIKELEDAELLLPIEYTLPHIVTDDNDAELHFAKADHSESGNARDAVPFIFKPLHNSQSQQSLFLSNPRMKNYGYGYLSTKHCCYLCIEAKVKRDDAMEMGYCLHTLIKKVDDSHYEIVLLCTYFLEKCYQVRGYCFLHTFNELTNFCMYRHCRSTILRKLRRKKDMNIMNQHLFNSRLRA